MSQGNLQVPTTGPRSPTLFAGDINGAASALATKNSGGSAPANFSGGAVALQDWGDTSPGGGLVDEREYDGSNWLRKGAQDQTAHVWMPIIGGGSGTIAAGGTTDIGSIRQGYMTVTGSVPGTPITSFGSNALLTTGETKFLRFTASGIITHNATSMICPGATDLPFNAGDTLQVLYLGSGNWLLFDYRSNVSPVGRNTGDAFERWGTGAITGAVRANGGTIGNGSSGGTERANADTVNLFILLYVTDTSLAVSGGRTAPGNTRTAAITDFNLNKTIALPDMSLRVRAPVTFQYLLSGTAATYTTPANCKKLVIRMVGAGGGGGGSTGAGSAGGNTSFNSIVATGGGGGPASGGAAGVGGTGGAGSASLRIAGGDSQANTVGGGGSLQQGWTGGASVFGGAGKGNNGAGSNGKANSGGGGGGFGSGSNNNASGGGAGEYVELEIVSPSATYTYTVGAGGAGGSGTAGGTGGSGIIIVEEHCSYNITNYLSL